MRGMGGAMKGEVLRVAPEFRLVRDGRFVVAEVLVAHRVISTSPKNGGQREELRWLVNHQSCEGTDHRERHAEITGGEAYHDSLCLELEIDPAVSASMQTAANMNYAAVVTASDLNVTVTAVVTAGVHGNAT